MRDDQQHGMYLPDDIIPEKDFTDDPQAEAIVAEAVELAAAVLKIAGEYNIRNMSPNDLAEMSRRLYYAGAIGLAEHAILCHQPHLVDDYDPDAGLYRQLGLEPDTPRDLLGQWQEHLRILQEAHADPDTLGLTSILVELLESFQPFDDDDED
jgi:hypothetical protein